MCIDYISVPAIVDPSFVKDVGARGFSRQGFGRAVPLALGPMLADEAEREPLRRAARDDDWGLYASFGATSKEGLFQGLSGTALTVPLAPLWGGPPARVIREVAWLSRESVAAIAAACAARSEASLREAHEREREHVSHVLGVAAALECHAMMAALFAAARDASQVVAIRWAYA